MIAEPCVPADGQADGLAPDVADDDEAQRLQALDDLLIVGSPPDADFDRICRVARHALQMPVAVISLVEAERQWFKSAVGVDLRETPRSESFCTHAIRASGLLVVEDAAADPRFSALPVVTGPLGVRFYAGCPLHTPEGWRVGTLCVMDRRPRRLDAAARAVLRDLAALVERGLQAHRLAHTDALTGLLDRRGLSLALERELERCRNRQLPGLLLYFDLDGFKQINDRLGHEAGDRALKLFADALRAVTRPGDLKARLGGDEFIAWLPACPEAKAEQLAQRLRQCLVSLCASQGLDGLGFSVGLSAFDPARPLDADNLLMRADAAMFRAKSASKAR